MFKVEKIEQSGRSMVEMLGVLAIIGVLSVGGIMGYTTAMRKYKANEIVQAITMTAMAAKAANMGTGTTATTTTFQSLTGESTLPQGCTSLSAAPKGNYIRVYTDTTELCLAVQSIIGSDSNQRMYIPTANDCMHKNTTTNNVLYVTVKS